MIVVFTVITPFLWGIGGAKMGQYDIGQVDEVFSLVETAIKNKDIRKDFGAGPIVISPEFIRDDQENVISSINDGDIKYPFVTYKIINDPIEDAWNHIFQDESGGLENDDPNKPFNRNIRYVKVRPMISINIIAETADGLDACNTIAREILAYFWTTDLQAALSEGDNIVKAVSYINNQQIENRSTEIDGEFEYKLGFDIEIEFEETIETVREAVRKIVIGSNTELPNGVAEGEITQETN